MRLTEMPSMGMDGQEGDDLPVKIAIITFAFENSKIINWLKERGLHIKNENWANLEKTNNKINDALKNDQVLLDNQQKPVSIFATFETEEGY